MSSEETLIQIRKDKHQEINGGTYPLISEIIPFVNHSTIGYVNRMLLLLQNTNKLQTSIIPSELYNADKYVIRGRIAAFRKSGAITFIKLTDFSGSIQVIISKSSYDSYDNLKLFDLGDIVEIGGRVCCSKTGERSLLAFSITLLTKAHRPPPEKFVGIADQELKYRKRYLDLMSSEESRARFTVRTYILRAIREYMESRNFLEVETSTLNTVSSGANAKPFTTHHNALDIDLRLRIAPELYLKRLLVGGLDRVYEIGRNYRNEGIDTRHNPEFTMMESYQAYGNFPELLSFTKTLLNHIISYLNMNLPSSALEFFRQWQNDSPVDFCYSVEVTMEQAVQNALDKLEMKAYLDRPWHGEWYQFTPPECCTSSALQRRAKIDFLSLLLNLNKSSSRGERVATFFEYLVEPFLFEDYRTISGLRSVPVFITDYPKDISPLARSKDSDPSICDRFELFIEGQEVANAFQELNNPEEQALRFQEQLQSNNKDPMDFDLDYVEALEYGMPPAVGFGMGIDRLVMILTNTTSIKDVILFPTLRPEK